MDLFFSTSKFRLHAQGYTGFPLLISGEGRVVEEALDFCIAHLIKNGRVQSRKSWVTYGKALYQFFGWCEVNGIDWRDVGNDREATILAEFRDWNLSPEGGSLAAATVNSRLRLLCAFYRYAAKRGWVTTVPYTMETLLVRQPKGFLAHVDASGGMRTTADVMLSTPRTVIRVLSRHQSNDLLNAITNPTHQLIVRLALTTGLRREELATFPLKYVINPVNYTSFRSFIRVFLDPRDMTIKRNQPREIDIPRTVMEALWQYVLDRRHQHESISGQRQSVLFLTESGQPYANDGAAFLGIVKKGGAAAGIPYINVHILRHTYATQTLYLMMRDKAQTHALLYVRDRLGHGSVTTTEQYLHSLSEFEDALMDDYQSELDLVSREVCSAKKKNFGQQPPALARPKVTKRWISRACLQTKWLCICLSIREPCGS